MATHSSILAWGIPWTEEPGGYSPWGHKESDTTEQQSMHLSSHTSKKSEWTRTPRGGGTGGREEVFVISTPSRCEVEPKATEKPAVAKKAMHTYPASRS